MGSPSVKAKTPDKMDARRGFGGYESGKRKAVNTPDVVIYKNIERLLRAYKELGNCETDGIGVQWSDAFISYSLCLLKLYESGRIRYSPGDIAEFALAFGRSEEIDEHTENILPLFLSVLVNKSRHRNFRIMLGHLDMEAHSIGYLNTTNVHIIGDVGMSPGHRMKGGVLKIEGNVGFSLGLFMKGGRIIVTGNAAEEVGSGMDGGEIIIHGNAGDALGDGMNGGKITVFGNSGRDIGENMQGGEIHLEGDYEGIAGSIERGKIYHKGKLIFEK